MDPFWPINWRLPDVGQIFVRRAPNIRFIGLRPMDRWSIPIVNRENDRLARFIVSPYISTARIYPQLPDSRKLFFRGLGGLKYTYFCCLGPNRYGLCKEWATLHERLPDQVPTGPVHTHETRSRTQQYASPGDNNRSGNTLEKTETTTPWCAAGKRR